MSRAPKPYIKCERRDGEYHLTLMGSTGRQLTLAGRDKVAVGDNAALRASVIKLVNAARGASQSPGKQANGDS